MTPTDRRRMYRGLPPRISDGQSGNLRGLTVENITLIDEHLRALSRLNQIEKPHLAHTGIDAAGVHKGGKNGDAPRHPNQCEAR